MELREAIKKRHSVRSFSTKKPDWREVIECIDVMTYGPLAGNIPVLKFIMVSDSSKIQRIAELCHQEFVADAPYVVIVCSSKKKIEGLYEGKAHKYTTQEAGAAIENFLLAITEKRLGTCWIGLFDEEELKRFLRIPDDGEIEAVFPVGFELKSEKQKRKPDLDSCLYFDEWKNRYMKR